MGDVQNLNDFKKKNRLSFIKNNETQIKSSIFLRDSKYCNFYYSVRNILRDFVFKFKSS